MGVDVPNEVFERALTQLLSTQERSGPTVVRTEDAGAEPNGRRRRKTSDVRDRARGWAYTKTARRRGAYGSMTAGALGALVICRNALIGTEGYEKELDERAEQAIWDGIAWFSKWFRASTNPRGGSWVLYYLYAVERAGVLSGVDRFGPHDWYGEGTEHLLSQQVKDGTWSGAVNVDVSTCFALLFLKRGTRPVARGAVTRSVEVDLSIFERAQNLTGKPLNDFVGLVVSRFRRANDERNRRDWVRGLASAR